MGSSSLLRVVVSVMGYNRPGILAELTARISEHRGNIMDIGQKIVGDYFCTLLIVELPASASFTRFKEQLEGLGGGRDYKVMVQNEKVFSALHRV